MKFKIGDLYIKTNNIIDAVKIYRVIKTNDERLNLVTYKLLKEMGFTKERWKNLTQEEANKILAQKREYLKKKQEKEGKSQGPKENEQQYEPERKKTYFENTINKKALTGHTPEGKVYKSSRKTLGPKTAFSSSDVDDDRARGGTLQQYVVNGQLTDEREALHEEIIDDMFKDLRKSEKQEYVFLGGGPASGKSTLTESMLNDTWFHADADEIKKRLPEYDEGYPSSVHEESSALVKRAKRSAIEEGYNVLDDSTGDGSVEKMLKRIKSVKDKGLKAKAIYVTTDIPTAIERDSYRSRSVGKEEVTKIHKAVSNILPQIAKEFDEIKLYRNFRDKRQPTILIATGGNGKPLTATKGNEEYLKQFLAAKDYKES